MFSAKKEGAFFFVKKKIRRLLFSLSWPAEGADFFFLEAPARKVPTSFFENGWLAEVPTSFLFENHQLAEAQIVVFYKGFALNAALRSQSADLFFSKKSGLWGPECRLLFF